MSNKSKLTELFRTRDASCPLDKKMEHRKELDNSGVVEEMHEILIFAWIGANADSWNKVTRATEVSGNSACLDLAEMVKRKATTYSALYLLFQKCVMRKMKISYYVVSLGSVLALNYADRLSQKVKGLVLIAAQYKMPTRLLKLQTRCFILCRSQCFNKPDLKTRFYKSV